ncbi:hypothetical protein BV20DRAFT_962413 [Pilatotrama ljubarskyi]|nr:hypothetical protein BV20DRAFT_962413 [Pilatotrama ljubarskyi]
MPAHAAYARRLALAFLLCFFMALVVLPVPGAEARPGDCDAGEFWDTSRSRCTDCPAGTFTGVDDATSCCTCCAGYYQDNSGSSSCKKCPSNRPYSPAGSTSSSQCRSNSGTSTDSCSQSNKNTCPNTGGGNPSPRAVKRREGPGPYGDAKCPFGWRSCPVYGLLGKGGEGVFECVDVRRDLESCGGCVNNDSPSGERTAGGGRDCSAIPNVDEVRCARGECVIRRCAYGYSLTEDGDRCVRDTGGWEAPAAYYGIWKRGVQE